MGSSTELKRERKRKGLCAVCGGRPQPGSLRCEPCLERQRGYDRAWRASQKGAKTVEPQCKLPDGKMRAEHVFDEDGLCDCSARRMEFAPRPPLRPEMVRTSKVKPSKVVAPPVVRTPAPASVPRAAAKPEPTPRAKRRAIVPAPQPEKRIGDTTFAALISDLERKREQVDRCITAAREIEEWWPR